MEKRESKSFPLRRRVKAGLVATGMTVFAFLFGDLLSIPFRRWGESTSGFQGDVIVMGALAVSFVGMTVAGIIYLLVTSRGLEYVDLHQPSLETAKYALFGAFAATVFMIVFNITVSLFDVPVAEGWLPDIVDGDVRLIGLLLVVVFLFNAPAEEFLFRNIVQKRLAETFHVVSAIGVTSVLFALVHLPGYLVNATLAESVVPVTVIFAGSVIFGWLYAYTEDLMAVIGAHAFYNAVQLLLLAVTI